ncbi:MAG: MBL fold metallo-hydrolase [Bdellovibrionales bacterium]|nr:MBL fold metallo-hydrolase [Bdellovibrionales bacterium]
MFKILISVFLVFLSLSHAQAMIQARWFSVASVLLEDGETQIMFDPMFTRAGIKHWLLFSKLKSDEELVTKIIKEHQLNKITALFASHSHYDHVIDAPMFAKLTGATFYVDESSERVAAAYKESKIRTQRFQNLAKIKIGKFTITPIMRRHSPIRAFDLDWLPGEVPKDFDFGIYDYHVGDTWFYYIEHPEGNILLDQGSEPNLDKLKPYTTAANFLIQGIANRSSDDAILKGYIEKLKPTVFIPTHFDNFFFAFDPAAETSYLPGIDFENLMAKLKKAHPGVDVIMPVFGKKIELVRK